MASVLAFGCMLLNRYRTSPVTLEPSRFLAVGTVTVWSPARGEISPCQPLTRLTCPSFHPTALPLPRFGTSYISTPLAFDMSIGERSALRAAGSSPELQREKQRSGLACALALVGIE